MPIYVYGCPHCDVLLEELRSVDLADFPPVECPACHGLCVREMATFNIGGRAVEQPAHVGAGIGVDLNAAGGRDQARFEVGDAADPGLDRSLPHGPTCPCCFGRTAV